MTMPSAPIRLLALVTALAAGAPLAAAQKKAAPRATGKNPLERARNEIGELRYEDAQKTVDKALRSGTNGPPEMAELYLLEGEVQASLGDEQAAQEAFRKALVIDP